MHPTPRALKVPLATGLQCHLLEWASDDPALDHTVILIHGLLDMGWGWSATVEAGLAGRFHLVAPDLRGHGDTDHVGAGGYYHFFDYLADIHSIIEQLGRERVSLVGHSLGGSIASYYAGCYPQVVHRLALLEGIGMVEMRSKGPELIPDWIAGWKRAKGRERSRYGSVPEAAARLRRHDPLLGEELAFGLADKATLELDDGGRQFKHDPLLLTMGPAPFRFESAEPFWRAITCPVLFVEGEESLFRHPPEEKERRLSCFVDCRSEVLPGAGHMMQRHQPAALARLLRDFLGD